MSALFAPLSALDKFVDIFGLPFFNESPSGPKKLPADYALKHHIKLLNSTYNNGMLNINMGLENIGYEDYGLNRRVARRAARNALKLFKFMVDPMSAPLFMYQHGFKEHVIAKVRIWTNDALEIYDYLSPKLMYDIKTVAILAITAIELIPFVRHVE